MKGCSKLLSFLLSIALLSTTCLTGVAAKSPTVNGAQASMVTMAEVYGDYDLTSEDIVTVIVELKSPSVVEAKHTGKKQSAQSLFLERSELKKKAVDNSIKMNVLREYDHVFSGFAAQLPANNLLKLASLSEIKAIYPNVHYTTTEATTKLDLEALPTMLNSAPYIGAPKAWDLGFTGKGVTVAVIDTGVDYTHPDLAHAFGTYKGWDFVDNDNDPQETPPGDPRGEATNHGTHVAGTIAANGLIKGIAPEASLLAYRVLGPGGSGSTTNVLAGIEKAVKDGAKVMNLSLGNTYNHPDFATSIALDWSMAEGVVAVTSNGNAGPDNWTVGSPGTSRNAISVGATDMAYNLFNAQLSSPGKASYPSAKVMGFPTEASLLALDGKTFDFVYVGLGRPTDFHGKEVEGKIALISRGGIPFVDKVTNAKVNKAVGAIIFNNVAGEIPFYISGMDLPTAKLSNADGLAMLAETQSTVTFNFQQSGRMPETVADFSSRGPVMHSWMIKPDVCAPGVSISSTIPGGYGLKQGTSMASPHVAGAAALILQANPGFAPQDVKAALMNTAELLVNPATGKPYPHNTQGAGSIRVLPAINTKTLITPGSHSYGVFKKDEGKQVVHQHFTIKNLSSTRQRYTATVDIQGNPEGIKVMTSNNLQVQPGKEQKFNINVQVDAAKLNPGYYEGSITISDGTTSYVVPTILFVQEPDYPRIQNLWFAKLAEGDYLMTLNVPVGADYLDLFVYTYPGRLGTYVGDLIYLENVPAGLLDLPWDGKINGSALPLGQDYVIFVIAEKYGVTTTRGYIITLN